MFGLDEHIAQLGGGSLLVTLAVALLLGLRHATDPDHLTAVCTLALGDERGGGRRAGLLGLAWGAGHAVTLLAFGIPVVAYGNRLPEAVTAAAEVAVGVLIIALAGRLLVRRRDGTLHVHAHTHGTVRHAHPHAHAHGDHEPPHDHPHAEALGRTPPAAFGIGLVHGLGGSAGVSIVVVAGAARGGAAAAALALLAAGAAISMAVVSAAFGRGVTLPRDTGLFERLVPYYGVGAMAFGAWYVVAALPT
jgi:ABC-type nickel/cobalt efflux system permease component RcnA